MRAGFILGWLVSSLIWSPVVAAEPSDAKVAKSVTIAQRLWSAEAPRAEVQPEYATSDGTTLALKAQIEGVDGWWQCDIPIEGGKTYRLAIARSIQQLATPHRSAVVRIDWLDQQNRRVPSARPFIKGILEGYNDMQQPDYLSEPEAHNAATEVHSTQGWQTLEGTFLSPPTAVKARVELHLRWCEVGAQVAYRKLSIQTVEPVAPRPVKLATIHLQPKGGTPQANREAFVDVITQAAKAGAQLIVLPETLPYYGTGLSPIESAETVPGPSTEFFGALSRQLNVHLVATCFEKDGHHLYNTAMLLGPEGQLIGRYRKVCIPRGEIEAGVEPGTEYPVFETKLGRVGMMICYDGFFPQVAQRLTDAGAEVIAWPVWGCNPLLARARAAENQVAIVSSTYTEPDRDWMISAVYDPNGVVVAQATKWGSFAMAELDISRPPYWPSLGTHRSERFHHQPK